MSEMFNGKDFSVLFSSGAFDFFSKEIIKLGKEKNSNEKYSELVKFFENCADYPVKGIDFEYDVPEDFSYENLKNFVTLIEIFVKKIIEGKTDDFPDEKMKFYFVGQLLNTHILASQSLSKNNVEIKPLTLSLDKPETIAIRRLQLIGQYNGIKFTKDTSNGNKNKRLLALFREITNLSELDKKFVTDKHLLHTYHELDDLLVANSELKERLVLWKKIKRINSKIGDEDGILKADEIITELENNKI